MAPFKKAGLYGHKSTIIEEYNINFSLIYLLENLSRKKYGQMQKMSIVKDF